MSALPITAACKINRHMYSVAKNKGLVASYVIITSSYNMTYG